MRGGRCTNCGNQLERGFGLVNCLQCGTLLFIDLEGQVEKAESSQMNELENPSSPPPPPIQVAYDDPIDDPIQNFSVKSKAPAEVQKPPPLKAKPGASSTRTRGDIESPSKTSIRQRHDVSHSSPPVAEEIPMGFDLPAAADNSGQPSMDFSSSPESEPQTSALYEPSQSSEDFVDGVGSVDFLKGRSPEGEGLDSIRNFGNSDLSQGQDGSLYFDVIISGVDSKKIRDELRDCLTDRRFLWDVDQLIKSVRKGELRLEGLSSVKASVILSRLKELPVGLKWSQTGLTNLKQRDPNP